MNSLRLAILWVMIFPTFSLGEQGRQDRLKSTFVLKHRTTGRLRQFSETSPEEAVQALRTAGLKNREIPQCHTLGERAPDAEKGPSRSGPPAPDPTSRSRPPEDLQIEQRLELAIILEAFSLRRQSRFTDAQLDWLASLDLCDNQTRNGLRALSLMIKNYELLRGAGI